MRETKGFQLASAQTGGRRTPLPEAFVAEEALPHRRTIEGCQRHAELRAQERAKGERRDRETRNIKDTAQRDRLERVGPGVVRREERIGALSRWRHGSPSEADRSREQQKHTVTGGSCNPKGMSDKQPYA